VLRGVVLLLGLLALAGGLWALLVAALPPALVFAGWGVLIVVGTLYERVRYKALERGRPGPGWHATGERFIDDTTGKPVTVYVEATTGERKYVEE
jgi:hypothetical protein